MNIMNAILGAQDGQAVGALLSSSGCRRIRPCRRSARCFRRSPAACSATCRAQGGLEQLMSALTKGQHGRYLDEAGMLGSADT